MNSNPFSISNLSKLSIYRVELGYSHSKQFEGFFLAENADEAGDVAITYFNRHNAYPNQTSFRRESIRTIELQSIGVLAMRTPTKVEE